MQWEKFEVLKVIVRGEKKRLSSVVYLVSIQFWVVLSIALRYK